MRGIKQKVGWSAEDNKRLLSMKQEGKSIAEIAEAFGKSKNAVEVHYLHLKSMRTPPKKKKSDKGKYIIKQTDFLRGKVTVFKEVDIAFHGGSTKAWNYTMDIIRRANYKYYNEGKFFWVKYC